GSLYYRRRAKYPPIRDEEWFLFQLTARGRSCWVRINGDTVLEYDQLTDLEPGHIELQAHQAGRWLEFKRVRIRSL
ncbi:MAG TPA: family 16 glycoside hydrolase, partial [Bryobacteraceae bacterium]|nr:family 16 glycoside hydrolase [Bryobacteraceae bacterium]